MEIEVINSRPGRPVGVGRLVAALKKITPPDRPRADIHGPCILFHQPEGEVELQIPGRLLIPFRIDPGGQ